MKRHPNAGLRPTRGGSRNFFEVQLPARFDLLSFIVRRFLAEPEWVRYLLRLLSDRNVEKQQGTVALACRFAGIHSADLTVNLGIKKAALSGGLMRTH
jgi:hypothetical protein